MDRQTKTRQCHTAHTHSTHSTAHTHQAVHTTASMTGRMVPMTNVFKLVKNALQNRKRVSPSLPSKTNLKIRDCRGRRRWCCAHGRNNLAQLCSSECSAFVEDNTKRFGRCCSWRSHLQVHADDVSLSGGIVWQTCYEIGVLLVFTWYDKLA